MQEFYIVHHICLNHIYGIYDSYFKAETALYWINCDYPQEYQITTKKLNESEDI